MSKGCVRVFRVRIGRCLVGAPSMLTRACLPNVMPVVGGGWRNRDAVLSDAQWSVIEQLLPCSDGLRGRPFRDHRQVIEGIIYRYRCGVP